jgi:hypothetical protein
MKTGLIISFFGLVCCSEIPAQLTCDSYNYQQEQIKNNISISTAVNNAEAFAKHNLSNTIFGRMESTVIKIPVVVHILYHYPEEKIGDAVVNSQIDALNKYFRRKNRDTANIPSYFKSLAADCEIEFQLAISDPKRKATSGIVKKYTPITKWATDDKMKFSAEMGDDVWDPNSYLNIWVCNLDKFAGYASMPGGEQKKDGVVIGFSSFGENAAKSGYESGKTAVHEIGHWLSLKHLWGDENCGDDGVDDTPKQASYTSGCPKTIRVTCGNGPYGDMYMNYMDFTSDACVNMFTNGQKARMRAMFGPGGPRASFLVSKGLTPPLIADIPLPAEDDPKWLKPNLYPNPALNELILDLSYDNRWVGKNIFVTNLQGQNVMNVMITSKIQHIVVDYLQPGIYFLAAKKDNGVSMKLKFVKL